MDNAHYTLLTRQTGLTNEMQVVANNIANAATNGFRQEGLIFSEFVKAVENGPSLSMAAANVRKTSMEQGALIRSGGGFDLAIEGEGFFLLETPEGEAFTRAGSFAPNAFGDLVSAEGFRLLDAGGAAIQLPPDVADFRVATDGTISMGDQPVAQIGLFNPAEDGTLRRRDGVMFFSDTGFEPAVNGRVLQGFLEQSNVDPLLQMARMIEVQRAYEMGQTFLTTEDERIRGALDALG